MKTYTEEDMIAFATYMLSEQRTKMIKPKTSKKELTKTERLKMVHHSDWTNWSEEQLIAK